MKDYNLDPFEENPSLDSRVEEGIHVVPDAATTKQQQEHISVFNQLQEENENPQEINADYNRSSFSNLQQEENLTQCLDGKWCLRIAYGVGFVIGLYFILDSLQKIETQSYL